MERGAFAILSKGIVAMKKVCKVFLKMIEVVFKHLLLALLVLILLFALLIQLDSYRIIDNAESIHYQAYKPVQEDTLSFEQLQADNPEVIAWLTLDGTNIDYPVVQSKDNEKYVNTSVFGEFSLTGAIFLDYRNAPDFSDTVSILYGHNMVGEAMFGGIDLFAEEEYFRTHPTGTLYANGTYYRLNIFAYFKANGHDSSVYCPALTEENYPSWLENMRAVSVNVREPLPPHGPVLLMSTCSSGRTDERNLLAATITPGGEAPAGRQEAATGGFWLHVPAIHIEELNIGHLVIAFSVWLLLTVIFILLKKKGHRHHAKKQRAAESAATGGNDNIGGNTAAGG